jgi:hypothetical protein
VIKIINLATSFSFPFPSNSPYYIFSTSALTLLSSNCIIFSWCHLVLKALFLKKILEPVSQPFSSPSSFISIFCSDFDSHLNNLFNSLICNSFTSCPPMTHLPPYLSHSTSLSLKITETPALFSFILSQLHFTF